MANTFRQKFHKLLKYENITIIDRTGDKGFNALRDECTITLIACTEIHHLKKIKNVIVRTCGLDVAEIALSTLKAIYFKTKDEKSGFIFSPAARFSKPGRIKITTSTFVATKLELEEYCKKNNLHSLLNMNYSSHLVMSLLFELMVSRLTGINRWQCYFNIFYNSHLEYNKAYTRIAPRTSFATLTSQENYNNINVFSKIYQLVIHAISNTLGNESNLTLHDIGCGACFFPLLLASHNGKAIKTLNLKKISAFDIDTTNFRVIKAIIKEKKYKPIKFNKLDVLCESAEVPHSDIITLIHILEHLPDDRSALSVVQRLWKCAEQLLVIAVPFETEENKWFEHTILFDANKLRNWASTLEGGEIISDSLFDCDGSRLTDIGILVIKRRKCRENEQEKRMFKNISA